MQLVFLFWLSFSFLIIYKDLFRETSETCTNLFTIAIDIDFPVGTCKARQEKSLIAFDLNLLNLHYAQIQTKENWAKQGSLAARYSSLSPLLPALWTPGRFHKFGRFRNFRLTI